MTAPLDLSQWRLWAFRAVYTQANAAGGAIVVDFTPSAGNTMIVMSATAANSGTNDLEMVRVDEDNNDAGLFCDVGSGAATLGSVPRVPAAVATSNLHVGASDFLPLIFSGENNDKFTIRQNGAGAANDTLTINIRALLRHGVLPTRTKARSTNPNDVTETAPTINRMVT